MNGLFGSNFPLIFKNFWFVNGTLPSPTLKWQIMVIRVFVLNITSFNQLTGRKRKYNSLDYREDDTPSSLTSYAFAFKYC